MSQQFLRVYKKVDINDIKEHLLICGDLTANCSKCNAVGLKFNMTKCPECQTYFKYMAFRNIKGNMPKLQKLSESVPDLTFVDYDDYKRIEGAQKARDFFK